MLNQFLTAYDEVIVATGDNDLREYKLSILTLLTIPIATIVHPTAVISPFTEVGTGCTILANAVININAAIGQGCIINNGAIVEHDCIIGD